MCGDLWIKIGNPNACTIRAGEEEKGGVWRRVEERVGEGGGGGRGFG